MLKRIVLVSMRSMLISAMFVAAIVSNPASAKEAGIGSEIEQVAFQGVQANDDWEPYVQEFNGVEMVLVPAGCFMMGSTEEQIDYAVSLGGLRLYKLEQPANQQCFDQPFWIDKYEVTNVQFEQLGGVAASESRWTDDNRPRETINWFEARDFCALRGGYLPTEAEWEYVARGPDNLIFPWGNTFVPENVVYADNSDMTTAEVGSKPDGASWVGALDMSGNVGEWTSSIFMDYPYDAADDREDNTDDRSPRVLRGGSYNLGPVDMRAAVRTGLQYTPFSKGYLHGTRCARSYQGSLLEEGAISIDDFESGALATWTLDCSGSGCWYVYDDGSVPPNPDQTDPNVPFSVPNPPQGNFAAVTDMDEPGTRILYRDLELDGPYTLHLTVFYRNWDDNFYTPDTLAYDGMSNQQYRIDLVDPSASIDTLAEGDVLATIFHTSPNDPSSLEPTTVTFDLSPWAGQTVRLRLANVDNQGPLRAGVDNIYLEPTEP